jgi:rRNA maturation RNase YbeY
MVKSSVQFGYADRSLSLDNKRGIRLAVADLVKRETGMPAKLQYVFCSDEYLYRMNVSFLNHDDYTDIITFDLSEDREKCIEGEIYISVDRVKENGIKLGTGFRSEILRVIFHGALHLCGYQDKTKPAKQVMRSKEDEYLALFLGE